MNQLSRMLLALVVSHIYEGIQLPELRMAVNEEYHGDYTLLQLTLILLFPLAKQHVQFVE